ELLGGVLEDLLGVRLIDRLLGIAAGALGGGIGELGVREAWYSGPEKRERERKPGGKAPHDTTSSGVRRMPAREPDRREKGPEDWRKERRDATPITPSLRGVLERWIPLSSYRLESEDVEGPDGVRPAGQR